MHLANFQGGQKYCFESRLTCPGVNIVLELLETLEIYIYYKLELFGRP